MDRYDGPRLTWLVRILLNNPNLKYFVLLSWEALEFKNLTVTTTIVKDTNYSKLSEDKRISSLGQNNFAVSNHSLVFTEHLTMHQAR